MTLPSLLAKWRDRLENGGSLSYAESLALLDVVEAAKTYHRDARIGNSRALGKALSRLEALDE